MEVEKYLGEINTFELLNPSFKCFNVFILFALEVVIWFYLTHQRI